MEKPERYTPMMLRLKESALNFYCVGENVTQNEYGPFQRLSDALEIIPRANGYIIYELKTKNVLYFWDDNTNLSGEWILTNKEKERMNATAHTI